MLCGLSKGHAIPTGHLRCRIAIGQCGLLIAICYMDPIAQELVAVSRLHQDRYSNVVCQEQQLFLVTSNKFCDVAAMASRSYTIL